MEFFLVIICCIASHWTRIIKLCFVWLTKLYGSLFHLLLLLASVKHVVFWVCTSILLHTRTFHNTCLRLVQLCGVLGCGCHRQCDMDDRASQCNRIAYATQMIHLHRCTHRLNKGFFSCISNAHGFQKVDNK